MVRRRPATSPRPQTPGPAAAWSLSDAGSPAGEAALRGTTAEAPRVEKTSAGTEARAARNRRNRRAGNTGTEAEAERNRRTRWARGWSMFAWGSPLKSGPAAQIVSKSTEPHIFGRPRALDPRGRARSCAAACARPERRPGTRPRPRRPKAPEAKPHGASGAHHTPFRNRRRDEISPRRRFRNKPVAGSPFKE